MGQSDGEREEGMMEGEGKMERGREDGGRKRRWRKEGKMEGEREDGGGNGKMKGRQKEERIAFFSYHTKKTHWLAVSA